MNTFHMYLFKLELFGIWEMTFLKSTKSISRWLSWHFLSEMQAFYEKYEMHLIQRWQLSKKSDVLQKLGNASSSWIICHFIFFLWNGISTWDVFNIIFIFFANWHLCIYHIVKFYTLEIRDLQKRYFIGKTALL